MNKKKMAQKTEAVRSETPEVHSDPVVSYQEGDHRCSCGGYLWEVDGYLVCGDNPRHRYPI